MTTITLTKVLSAPGAVTINYIVSGLAANANKVMTIVCNDITDTDNGSDWLTQAIIVQADANGAATANFIQSGLTNGISYVIAALVDQVHSNTITISSSNIPLAPILSVLEKLENSINLSVNTGANQGSAIISGTVFYKSINAASISYVEITSGMIAAMVYNVITVPVPLSQDVTYEIFAIVNNGAGINKSNTIITKVSTVLDPVVLSSIVQENSIVTAVFNLPANMSAFSEVTTNAEGLVTNIVAPGVSFKGTIKSAGFTQTVTYVPVLAPGVYDPVNGKLVSNRVWATPVSFTFTITDGARQFVSGSFVWEIVSECPNPNGVTLNMLTGAKTVVGMFGTDLSLPSANVVTTSSGSYPTTANISLATKLYFNSAALLNAFNGVNTGFVPTSLTPYPPTLTINARWVQNTVISGVVSLPAINCPNVVIGISLSSAVVFTAVFASQYFGVEMKLQLQSVSNGVSTSFVDAGVSEYIQVAPQMNSPLTIVNSEYNNSASFLLSWLSPNTWGEPISSYSLYQTITTTSTVDNSTQIVTNYKYPNDFLSTVRQGYVVSDAAGNPLVQATTYTFKVVANGSNLNTATTDVSNGVSASLAFGAMYIKDQVMGVVNNNAFAQVTWRSDPTTQIAWITYPGASPNYTSLAAQAATQMTTYISAYSDMRSATQYTTTSTALPAPNGSTNTYYFQQSFVNLGITYYSEIQSFVTSPVANVVLSIPLASYTYYAITSGANGPVTATTISTCTLAQAKLLTPANASNIQSIFSVIITSNGSTLTNYSVLGVPALNSTALMAAAFVTGSDFASHMVGSTFSMSYAGIYSAAIMMISSNNGGALMLVPAAATITSV